MLNGPLVQSPGDADHLASTLRFVQSAISMDLECCIPAKVIGYDRVSNTATIRPMIMNTVRSSTGGDLLRKSRKDIPNIPVLSLGAGNFHISFPMKEGDLGWLYACDRDITLFLQSLQEQPSGSDGATHSFSDAIFIPDVYRQYTINPEDEGALVIQSVDATTRISVRSDNIKLTAPVQVELDVPETICTGNLTVQKNLTVIGPQATLPQATTVGGAVVYGHTHNGQVPAFQ